jgi:hypothetical protein
MSISLIQAKINILEVKLKLLLKTKKRILQNFYLGDYNPAISYVKVQGNGTDEEIEKSKNQSDIDKLIKEIDHLKTIVANSEDKPI